nr:coiled-coil domain-containing protein 25 [Quercus suber]
MVYYFTSNVVSPAAFIYVGKDKVESEKWDSIAPDLLVDCAQLTKANSIEGNKKDNVTVIYTPWSNLKKSGAMATGQVGFKNDKMVKRLYVEKRENAIVNRLNKTKVEKYPDFREEKAARERELRKRERIAAQEKKKDDARLAEERQRLKWQKDHMYDDIHTEDQLEGSSNQDRDPDYLDDFM